MADLFQSTLPAWEATVAFDHDVRQPLISIHASRVGSDVQYQSIFKQARMISIHASRVGSDFLGGVVCPVDMLFQSTLPAWEATRAT